VSLPPPRPAVVARAIRAALREAAVLAFFLVLAAAATRPLVLDLAGQMFPGPDPLIDLWTVHWLTSHLLEPSRLFEGDVFQPFAHAVLHSDLSLGTVVLIAPLRLVVRDPVPLYNAAVLAALAFGGWAFHRLGFELTGSRSAGLLAGVLAAFSSHQLSHLVHLNLLSIGWLALFLVGLFRLRDRPSFAAAALAGVSFALSAQSSGYYAVAAALVAVVFAGANLRLFRERRALAAALGAVLLAFLLTAPYLRAFLALRRAEGLRRAESSSLATSFHPGRDLTSRSYVYRGLLGNQGERLFPGLLALGLGGFALWRRRPESAFLGAAGLVLLLVSLGPRLEVGAKSVALPYDWLFEVPPLDSMRHPFTFAAVATFLLAVLAALGWAASPFARRRGAAAAIVALAVAESLGRAPAVRPTAPGVPPAYAILSGLPRGPILDLPVLNEDTLLWAARHGLPVVNGDGAFTPPDTATLDREVRRHWLAFAPDDLDASKPAALLERFHVRYVIVPRGRLHGLRALANAFDRSRAFAFVAEAPDRDRIYEARAAQGTGG
jgi:hypothetical protein